MRTTKRALTMLAAIAMILSVLSGCGNSASKPQDPADSPAEETKLYETDKLYTFDTASATGNWYAMGALIADAMNKYYTTDPVTAAPSAGSLGNPALVSSGEADFGMSYGSFLVMAAEGSDPYEGKLDNLSAVLSLSPTLIHVWADAEKTTPETTLESLVKEQTATVFGCMTAGKGSYFVTRQMFGALGVGDLDDISSWGASVYYADGSDLINAWKDRQVDVVMNLLNAPDSLVEDALVSRSGYLLGIGDELSSILNEKYGFLEYTIPAGTYSTQDYDVKTLGLPLVIFTRDDVDEEIVYNMCKAVNENIADLIANNAAFADVDMSQIHLGGGVKLHPGAERYYKEIGLIA